MSCLPASYVCPEHAHYKIGFGGSPPIDNTPIEHEYNHDNTP